MDPITTTTAAAKIVSTTLQVVQTCNEYYQKYKAVDLQLVCMQTQCSIIEVALLQIQDVIVHDSARFERLRSVSVFASNYERTLGACQIVFAVLKERLHKLNSHLHDNCGKPDWQLKVKSVWNDQESAMLLKNIEGQASAISLLLNAIQMKTQIEMLGLLSRKESKAILKTASDDADTLSLTLEKNANFALSDGESVTTSKLDSREFEFDSEIINTAAYRKAFSKARSKLTSKKGSGAYSPPHAPTSGGAGTPETVGLPSINAHAATHSVGASQDSESFSSCPNASSSDFRSHSMLPRDSAEAAGDGTGGPREEEHDAGLENQPESTPKKNEFRIGEYIVGRTIGTGPKGKVKLAWKKDHSHQFAIKFIKREPDALGTGLPRNTLHGFVSLRALSHSNVIRLHNMFATHSYSVVVLDHIPGGSLAEYIAVHSRLSENSSQRFFTQIISAVAYLHRNSIVHSTLSCSKVLLDSSQNAILTGFSDVKTFDTQHMDRLMNGQVHRFHEGKQADVWSCGKILVSAQYGLISDINDLKYFMLAGYLPFPGGYGICHGCDAGSQLHYFPSTPVAFPEYFPLTAQDLVRQMLVEKSTGRVDLLGVVCHDWLSAYTHVVSAVFSDPIF